MKAILGRVEGRVQGVGFRAFVQQQAANLAVTGYVKNLADGAVEFVLQGDEIAVNRLLNTIKTGPRFSKVTSLNCEEVKPSSGYRQFSITE